VRFRALGEVLIRPWNRQRLALGLWRNRMNEATKRGGEHRRAVANPGRDALA
jgi:hypothetical protein